SASLCVVGLAMRRHPTVAWLALIVALSTITVDLASFGRDHRADLGPETWRWIALTIVLSAICATSAAVAYAVDPARRAARPLRAAGALTVVVVFGVGAWALATPDPEIALTEPARPLGDLVLVTRAFLITTLAFVVVGLLRDLRPAVERTTRRMASIRGRPRRPADALGYAAAWIRTFGEELTPGRAQQRRAAIAERARIARDLHAVVVPDLRRALREAENVGSVDRLAASLRDALRRVEAMVETRDAIGLEIGGLVAALESLAERVEDRSDVRVTIDVAESDGQPPASPPPLVAAAALRIAALALENVVRHAPSAQVRIVISSGPDRVALSIEDDGPGISPGIERAALEDGRRGLADMATEAALCGASLRSGLGKHGSGMVVAFDWPAS
ncbi:MAG TPA: ATP-binding protein, partial [Candidatus Limnocylindrales bacterium]|nr:ATP-binding protein [Candidatus Limnocylindrales bacterium]